MVLRVGVAPDIAHPDVKAVVGKDVGQTLIGQVDDPVGAGAEQPVLQEEHWTWT